LGFKIIDPVNAHRWYKWVAFRKGIGPCEFRKGQMRDWIDIMKIEGAIGKRDLRTNQVNKLLSKVRRN